MKKNYTLNGTSSNDSKEIMTEKKPKEANTQIKEDTNFTGEWSWVEEYDSEDNEEEYSVISKAFFYNLPDENTKSSKYLVEDDVVDVIKKENDFGYAEYTNEQGRTTKGWLKMSDITKIESDYTGFQLTLHQNGQKISGGIYHFARMQTGFLSVMDNDNKAISGTISNSEAKVKFASDFTGATGEATIKFHNDNRAEIEWTITKKNDKCYLPENAILKKISD